MGLLIKKYDKLKKDFPNATINQLKDMLYTKGRVFDSAVTKYLNDISNQYKIYHLRNTSLAVYWSV